MDEKFFDGFQADTKLKLAIFRDYVREWLPVFLTRKPYPEIVIMDGFCGQGTDRSGEPGTPLILLEEIKNYYQARSSVATETPIRILFNDKEPSYISGLQRNTAPLVSEIEQFHNNVHILFETRLFADFWQVNRSLLAGGVPALVILDQFGFRDLTTTVLEDLVSMGRTDFLAFLPSSYLKRFRNESSIQEKAPFDLSVLDDVRNSEIHQTVCDQYKKMIPAGACYHLAPFSIQQENHANIFGVIFGSGDLLGLEKFLNVAWKHDPWTGEKNFPANSREKDYRHSQNYLSEFDNRPEKIIKFEEDLIQFIKDKRPTNVDLYRFVLEHGFIPRIVNGILHSMERDGTIEVRPIDVQRKIRRGAYYINNSSQETVRFCYTTQLF